MKKDIQILSISVGMGVLFALIILLLVITQIQNVTINNMQDEINSLKERLTSCTLVLEKNMETIQELNEMIEDAEEQGEQMSAEIKKLKKKKEKLEKENESLREEINSLKVKIEELEDIINGYSFRVTPTEKEMMYYIVNAEMGDYSSYAIKMVACVIINRVMSDEFPNTISQVITQRNQFSTLSIWYNKSKQPYKKVIEIVDEVLAMSPQEIANISEGALFFYEPSICGYKSEFENRNFLFSISGCRFFS